VISVPFAALRARQAAQVVQCMSQLRQLSVSMMMYASANGGWIPAALPALPSGAIPSCPAAPGTPNYIYATPQVRIGAIASPSTYVTMYEPITNHARGVNFAYLDGHVAFISPARAQKMINELKAGYNPPRPANIR
jgi:prepilin-type processing-associated H-X9-DG protein